MPTQVYQKWPDVEKDIHFTGTNNTLFTFSSTMPKVLFTAYSFYFTRILQTHLTNKTPIFLPEIKNTK